MMANPSSEDNNTELLVAADEAADNVEEEIDLLEFMSLNEAKLLYSICRRRKCCI
jgi:5,10-methylenetetrahydrofolate reductase